MGSGASKARTEEETFEEVARTLSKAKRITVFSGAGVSVSSGIPDFRSPGGIWTRFDPMVYCDYENFLDKPEMFWTMVKCLYQDIHFSLGGSREELERGELRSPRPNEAHSAVADLEALGKRVSVVTQNIDGLHSAAASKDVIELHGTDSSCTCMTCKEVVSREEVLKQIVEGGGFRRGSVTIVPRHGGGCGGVLKADVVLFGEALPTGAMMKATKAVMASTVVLVVGSSLNVAPANMLPTMVKYRPFGKLVVLNLDTSGKEQADLFLQGEATVVLPKLVQRMKELMTWNKSK